MRCQGYFLKIALGTRLPDCCKLAINKKKDNNVTNSEHNFVVSFCCFFWRCRVFFVKFSYWYRFHVTIMNGFGVMTIFNRKRWPEIRYIPVYLLPNIWRLGQVRDTKFCTKISSKKLLNAAKFQGYSFYYLLVIKRKPIGGKIISIPQIRVKGEMKHDC